RPGGGGSGRWGRRSGRSHPGRRDGGHGGGRHCEVQPGALEAPRLLIPRMPAYRFIVQGRVQGVGYRYFARRQAEALGVTGYARNRADGTVEVVGEGTEDA